MIVHFVKDDDRAVAGPDHRVTDALRLSSFGSKYGADM